MKVKVLKDSIRFENKIYIPGETITGLSEEEIVRLKNMSVIEVLPVDMTDPQYKIQKLEEKISTLETEKDNLTKQNETLKSENEELKQELENLKQTKTRAKKE